MADYTNAPFPDLSPHFGGDECVAGAETRGILINKIPLGVWRRMERLALDVLEPWRDLLDGPLRITRFYANEDLNVAQGGVTGSQHTLGEAADCVPLTLDVRLAYEKLVRSSLPIDQAILYPVRGFIHVSHKSDRTERGLPNRNERLFCPFTKNEAFRRSKTRPKKQLYFDYDKWFDEYSRDPTAFKEKF